MQQYIEFLQANPVLTLAWIGIFIALVFTSVKAGLSTVKKITHQQATLLMNREGAIVLDVRSEAEFKKGRIIDSILMPLSKLKNNELGSLENKKDSPIIVVCNTGMTSAQACQMLQKAGFSNIHNLQGGITEWRTANLPLTKK
ncbi:rhodanese-like domain-containing protein [Psychrobium sp. 1_MG-2023]|uniref:rhodanese-like domain-containing protein n=1 Tax=Psychrobium sp. 1_MG-2023 TaxID=3062624 RepID=UPI000C32B40B|nr:rhodanese-like domain-containing protein [Psychrobium sp. 1_MG-2023]MDP2561058.1 rhodanese-like domain-containing protein [Psychrobium sp. 1_MG-2023]PKF58349.1 rhodanese-like domain-containing protein [Alteromonadales bacterium alter-6D02]